MKSKNITKFDKKIPLTAASNVHRLAKDLGIDLNDIELSSNNSRLSIDDVKRHVKERLKNQSNQISLQNDSDRKIQIGMHSYNIDYIEQMYEKWLSSEDLEPTWQSYFEGFELGKNFKALKAYELAEEYLRGALKIDKTNEWYLDELYDVYLKMKSTEQAIKVLKELLPFHNDYKEDLVDLYIDVKKYSSALNLLDELDESSNFSNEREKTRFKIYNLSNDFRAKESYLIKQIQKYPKKESYYLKLVIFYSEQNDIDNAFIIF